MSDPVTDHVRSEFTGREDLQRNWRWLLGLGVVWIVLGVLAIAMPLAAGIALELVLGAVLLVGGISQTFHAFMNRAWDGFAAQILGAVLAIVAGGLLLFFPMQGVITLTLLLGGFFVATGIIRVILGLQHRGLGGWGLLLASGVLGILIGILILAGWPSSALWAVGLLAGIELIFAGVSLSILGAALRRI